MKSNIENDTAQNDSLHVFRLFLFHPALEWVYLYTVLALSAEFIRFVSRNMVSQTGACTQVKWTLAALSVKAIFSEKARYRLLYWLQFEMNRPVQVVQKIKFTDSTKYSRACSRVSWLTVQQTDVSMFSKRRFLAIQPPDAAASLTTFHYILSPCRLHATDWTSGCHILKVVISPTCQVGVVAVHPLKPYGRKGGTL